MTWLAEAGPALGVLSAVALVAFFFRGITGAASAIVFNAVFVILLSFDLTGGLTLHDGLYWLALANAAASLLLVVSLRGSLVLDRLTMLYLAGTIPVSSLFAVWLTRMDGDGLALLLAVVVMLSGIYLAARPELPPADPKRLERIALPIGMVAGVIGGLYGMAGPIGFLLFSRATSDPSVFRGRLTVVTASASVVRGLVLASQEVYTVDRLALATASLPAVAGGVVLGMLVHKHVKPGTFRILLGALVGLAGFIALVESLGLVG